MSANKYDRGLAILDGGWGAQISRDTMWQQLEDGYDEGPDNIALVCMHQSQNYLSGIVGESLTTEGSLTWTYRQLMSGSKYLASALSASGAKRGDTLVTFLPSSAEWALCFWVAATLDLKFVPLDPAGLVDFDYPLQLLKPSVVLVATLKDAVNFDELYSDMSDDIAVKVVCHEQESFAWHTWISLESLENSINRDDADGRDKPQRSEPEDETVPVNRVAAILFNIDQPSYPKGCELTVQNIRTALTNQSFIAPKRFLVTSPASSCVTLEAVMVAWNRGGTVVFHGSYFSAEWTLDAIELHACTRLICLPSHLGELIGHPSLPTRQLESLQSLSVRGGVVNGLLLAEAQRVLQVMWASSSLSLNEGFGAIGWPGVLPFERTGESVKSVGTVMFGSRVKICDHSGRILKRGEEGNLYIGGETMIEGYLDGKSDHLFNHDEEGNPWFVTNYVAKMDDNGLIYLCGEYETP